jgi:hypothetical protein
VGNRHGLVGGRCDLLLAKEEKTRKYGGPVIVYSHKRIEEKVASSSPVFAFSGRICFQMHLVLKVL